MSLSQILADQSKRHKREKKSSEFVLKSQQEPDDLIAELLCVVFQETIGLEHLATFVRHVMNSICVPGLLTYDTRLLPVNTNRRNDHIQRNCRFECPTEFPVLISSRSIYRAEHQKKRRRKTKRNTLNLLFSTYLNIKSPRSQTPNNVQNLHMNHF